jgi:hypothetical protein
VTLLAKVVDSFALSFGYCVVWFEFLAEDGRIRVKDRIRLRTPDGRVRDTHVTGIERVKYSLLASEADRRKVGISLPPDIAKQDVPPGTEIWVAEAARAVVEIP